MHRSLPACEEFSERECCFRENRTAASHQSRIRSERPESQQDQTSSSSREITHANRTETDSTATFLLNQRFASVQGKKFSREHLETEPNKKGRLKRGALRSSILFHREKPIRSTARKIENQAFGASAGVSAFGSSAFGSSAFGSSFGASAAGASAFGSSAFGSSFGASAAGVSALVLPPLARPSSRPCGHVHHESVVLQRRLQRLSLPKDRQRRCRLQYIPESVRYIPTARVC